LSKTIGARVKPDNEQEAAKEEFFSKQNMENWGLR